MEAVVGPVDASLRKLVIVISVRALNELAAHVSKAHFRMDVAVRVERLVFQYLHCALGVAAPAYWYCCLW